MRNGQVAPFLVLLLVIIFLSVVGTMHIGEANLNKLRLTNICDSAILTAGSAFARDLNRIRQISIGPGGMLPTYVALQVFLLSRIPWPTKAAPMATGFFIDSIRMLNRLSNSAREIAEDAAKNLRESLYERSLPALIDEPKAFTWLRNETTKEIIGLDYNSWLDKRSYFTRKFKIFKRDNYDNWYKNDTLSYSWNRGAKSIDGNWTFISLDMPHPGEPTESWNYKGEEGPYDSQAKVSLEDVPQGVEIRFQRMVLVWLYATPSGIMPGFFPVSSAWIRRISFKDGSNTFSLVLDHKTRVSEIMPRNITLSHKSKLNIWGSIWSGYNLRLEE